MKAWTMALAAGALAACSQPAETPAPAPVEQQRAVEVPTGAYTLDPNHTTITVRARHFGLASYAFRFNRVSGGLNFNAEDPTQTTVNITADATSLDTPYAGDRDFDAELQNSQWLDSATYPTATFTSTSVERTGPNTARVTGDLTIRGAAHPATFDVTYRGSHARHPLGAPTAMIGFSAQGTFARSQYGMTVLQPRAADGGDGVSDQIELIVEAEFNRPTAQEGPAPNTPREPVN